MRHNRSALLACMLAIGCINSTTTPALLPPTAKLPKMRLSKVSSGGGKKPRNKSGVRAAKRKAAKRRR